MKTLVTDDLEMARLFNNFFANIGESLSKKIDPPPDVELSLPELNIKTIYLQPVSYFEIERIIQRLKAKKGVLIT